jgi:hypothetical protein
MCSILNSNLSGLIDLINSLIDLDNLPALIDLTYLTVPWLKRDYSIKRGHNHINHIKVGKSKGYKGSNLKDTKGSNYKSKGYNSKGHKSITINLENRSSRKLVLELSLKRLSRLKRPSRMLVVKVGNKYLEVISVKDNAFDGNNTFIVSKWGFMDLITKMLN